MVFSPKESKSRRRFVKGSYHNKMFDLSNVHIFDWNYYNNTDIRILCSDNSVSYIKIRKIDDDVAKSILDMNQILKKVKPNCRGKKYGDNGQMFALGYNPVAKHNDEYIPSLQNQNVSLQMAEIGKKRKEWYIKNFKNDYDVHFDFTKKLTKYEECLSDFMVHSVSLGNASHYDVNDESITVCTWVEEQIGNTQNWYFVLPNVTPDGKKALVIKLFHGCTISWEGYKIRHASSEVHYRLRGGGTSAGNCELRRKKKNRNSSNDN